MSDDVAFLHSCTHMCGVWGQQMCKIPGRWRMRALELACKFVQWGGTVSYHADPLASFCPAPASLWTAFGWVHDQVMALCSKEHSRLSQSSVFSCCAQVLLELSYALTLATSAHSADSASNGAVVPDAKHFQYFERHCNHTGILSPRCAGLGQPALSIASALAGEGGVFGSFTHRVDIQDLPVVWASHTRQRWNSVYEVMLTITECHEYC